MDESQSKTWGTGELAASCGVTVRTLRHYDRLGLVQASTRTPAGHRRYSESDVRRLYRVLALRQLALRLDAIGEWLETESDLVELVREHLDAVDDRLRHQRDLRDRIARLLDALQHTGRATTDDVIGVIEMVGMYDNHLTPEQQARLEHDRRELGFAGIDRWRADSEQALSAFRAAYESGADPGDPYVQELVGRVRQLKGQLVGHDHTVRRSLRRVHENAAWAELSAVVPQDTELRSFWKRARDAAPP
jgi:MerR family transcriptional regulator, thiopeptide resistance regulator